MIGNILTGAPVWVWPLLALLIYLGLRATRTRTAPAILIYCLPLLGINTLNSVRSLPQPDIAWSCFLLSYIVGTALGFLLQKRWILEKSGKTVTVSGEWLTLTAMMVLFWMNFAAGFTEAVKPDLYTNPLFSAFFALFVGWAGGSFLGRAFRVLRT